MASDVWSYGVVVWELFTMVEPFKEFDRAQQLVNIGRNGQKLFIPPPEHGFPVSIEKLLMRKHHRFSAVFFFKYIRQHANWYASK